MTDYDWGNEGMKTMKGKKTREDLINKLAEGWREAENYYLETEDDSKKWKMMERQKKAKLTPEETKDLEDAMTGMGI